MDNNRNTKPLQINFNGGSITSDAGILLFKEVDKKISLTESISKLIPDFRDQRYIFHTYHDMLRQRIAQISAGYEDANDCDCLRDDPIFKIFADRNPDSDLSLASQPTMTRFENHINNRTLYRLGQLFVDIFIQSYDKEPDVIVLDFDDTDDPVHGGQQLSLFNGYYKERCFMPLHVYEGLSGKLVTTILKPGRRSSGEQSLAILKRLVAHIQSFWPQTIILFRGDGHFTSNKIMDWIESKENIHFVTGLTAYAPLQREIEKIVDQLKEKHQKMQRDFVRYHSFYYKAGSWTRHRRVVVKIEVSASNTNVRFIVTDLEQARAKTLFEQVYQPRGQAELYIKEHKLYLRSDKTSCHKFQANQFRVFLHSAAYVLFHALKTNILKNGQWANATISTIRLRFLKIGAIVKELKTRINIEMSSSCPLKEVIYNSFQIFTILPASPDTG
jgi:hypothetical protein